MITEQGVLTYKSEVEKGTSKNGNEWQKMTIVVCRPNINAPYDKVALSVFGDKVAEASACKVGDKVEVKYSISAREYNGKWYNDVSLYSVAPLVPTSAAPIKEEEEDIKGDLPF